MERNPLIEAGLSRPIVALVVNALKRGRNGLGYEQRVVLPDGAERILTPGEQQPIRDAVDSGSVPTVAEAVQETIGLDERRL